jgi:hypothetical protein
VLHTIECPCTRMNAVIGVDWRRRLPVAVQILAAPLIMGGMHDLYASHSRYRLAAGARVVALAINVILCRM